MKPIKPGLLWLALLVVIALGARYWTDSHGPPIPPDGWESVKVFNFGEKRQFPQADPRAFANFLRLHSSGWQLYPPKGPYPGVATEWTVVCSSPQQQLDVDFYVYDSGGAMYWRDPSHQSWRRPLSPQEVKEFVRVLRLPDDVIMKL